MVKDLVDRMGTCSTMSRYIGNMPSKLTCGETGERNIVRVSYDTPCQVCKGSREQKNCRPPNAAMLSLIHNNASH